MGRELERLREAGQIGSGLQANVQVFCDAGAYARCAALGDELRFLFITSSASVTRVTAAPAAASETSQPGVSILVTPSTAAKCVRCWQQRDDVGQNLSHPELCSRCVVNVAGAGESRQFA